jgi:asparagine synthase (glutamine-hydrolysing)
LYGRAELARPFGISPDSESDIELLNRHIDRSGLESLAFLTGDFAFVVWDWGKRQLWAARDHFGVRQLFFLRRKDGMVLTSDLRPLLPLRPGSGRSISLSEVDPIESLMFLVHGRSRRDRTYFRGIGQVGPAESIQASGNQLDRRRYWHPPQNEVRLTDYAEYLDAWIALFRSAVHDRLRAAHPIALDVSGGLDSGSIAGAVNDEYSSGRMGSGPPIALSAAFPGLACDEKALIGATLERNSRLSSAWWDGLEPNHDDFDRPHPSQPGFHGALPTCRWLDARLAADMGARVVLAGDGGDELGWARGIFRDLLAKGRLWSFAREIMTFKTWSGRRRCFLDGLWGLLPYGAEDRGRRIQRRLAPLPEWLVPEMRHTFEAAEDEFHRKEPELFLSHVQRETWSVIARSTSYYGLDRRFVAAFELGVEVREPYFDVRLANFVLSVPWSARLPRGDIRRFQREGASSLLAPAVRNRLRKTTFEGAIFHQAESNRSQLTAILRSREWMLGDWVDQAWVREMYGRCLAGPKDTDGRLALSTVFRIGGFEAWLRALSKYDPGKRGPDERR